MDDRAGDDFFYRSNGTGTITISNLPDSSYTLELVSAYQGGGIGDYRVNGVFADDNYNGTPGVNGDNFNVGSDGFAPSNWLIWESVSPSGGQVTLSGQVVSSFVMFNAIRLTSNSLSVSSTDPADGSVVSTTPTEYVVNVSEPVVPGTLDASDFQVNSIDADGVAYTAGTTTITFSFASDPVTAQGVQTMQIAEDAFASVSDGTGVKEFNGSFRYDAVLMEVTSTDPADGSVVLLPATTLDLNFNEDYDLASADAGDFTINQGSVSGVSQVDGDTLRLTLDGVTSEGTLTVNMAAGAMTDVFGNLGAAFSASYTLDFGTTPYPVPLTPKEPLGSLIYDPSISGIIDPSGDTDTFTITVDPGQTITVAVLGDAGLQAGVTLLAGINGNNVLASGTASAPGEEVVLQTVATNGQLNGEGLPAKTYRIVVSGANDTTGSYSVQIVLNAALEEESHGGASNDTLADAQDLEGSFVQLHRATNANNAGAQPARGAVLGGNEQLPLVAVATYDFESGLQGWTIDNNIGGLWHLSTRRGTEVGHSPVTSFYYGNEATGNYNTGSPNAGAIVSPSFVATAGQTISFNYVLLNEGGSFYDQVRVEVSNNGGASWSQIIGSLSQSATWTSRSADLSAFAGQTIQVRFRFDTIDSFANSFEGAYIDDVQLNVPQTWNDYYSFTAAAGESSTVALTHLTGSGADIELVDADGSVLASGATGADNVDESLSYIFSAAGTYFVRVSGAPAATYSLLVTRNADFDTEDNNDIASAQEVLSTKVAGRQWVLGYVFQNETSGVVAEIEPNDSIAAAQNLDAEGWTLAENPIIFNSTTLPHVSIQGTGNNTFDYYSFTVANAGDTAIFDIDLTNGWDSYLHLFNSAGSQLAASDDNGGDPGSNSVRDSRINFTFAAPGTYIIRVGRYPSGNAVPSGASYTLHVSLQNHPTATGGPNGDFYEVTLAEGTPLEVKTSTPAGGSGEFVNNLDPLVRVYDAGGNLVASNDNGASDGRNALLTYNVPVGGAGTYYVEVTSSDATEEFTSGEYILSIKGNVAGDSLYLNGEAVGGGSAPALTDAALNSAVADAISFWQSAGAETSALGSIQFRTADLVGSMLGHHFDSSNTIVIDSNAAGRGWSFGSAGLSGGVDLFSTLAHELGHALGYDHLDHLEVMRPTLQLGAPSVLGGLTPLLASHEFFGTFANDGIRLAPARSDAQTTELSDGFSTDRLLNKDVIATGRPTTQSRDALVDAWFGRDDESDLDDLLSEWERGLDVDAIDEVLAQAENVGT